MLIQEDAELTGPAVEPDEIGGWSAERLALLRSQMTVNVTERAVIREERRPKGKLRYPALKPEDVWREFEEKTRDGKKVQIRWWRESDKMLLEGEAVEEHIKKITIYCALNRPEAENENYMWIYEVASGMTSTRPFGDIVIDMVATGKVAALVVPRKDRWSRNVEFNERSQTAHIKTDTPLCSVAEAVDLSTHAGRLFDTILTAFAQYDGAMTNMKLTGGRKAMLQNRGVYFGGEPPMGYRPIAYKGRGYRGILEICETEAEIVRLIFSLRGMGYRPLQIADWLNMQGILTRKGCAWTWNQVNKLVEREAQYRAEAIWHYTEGDVENIAHPPILPHRADPDTRTYMMGYWMTGTTGRHNKTHRPIWKKVAAEGFIPYGRTDLIICENPTEDGEIQGRKGRRKTKDLTEDQARIFLLLFRLVDAGRGDYAIAKNLNEVGLSTPNGKMWTPRGVTHYRTPATREHYEQRIQELGVTTIFLPIGATRLPNIADERARFEEGKEREHQAMAMMRAMREAEPKVSLKKIADAVNEAGLLTAADKRWFPTSVNRVLHGLARSVDIPSRERRLLAGHIDEEGTCEIPWRLKM